MACLRWKVPHSAHLKSPTINGEFYSWLLGFSLNLRIISLASGKVCQSHASAKENFNFVLSLIHI